jgi:hypothetical protein
MVMALHIRDFRQSDAAGLTRLSKTACGLGSLPRLDGGFRILAGLRGDALTGAVCFSLAQDTGVIETVLVAPKDGWQSDVQELIAEASLWLSSRGAARIALKSVPADGQLLARILEMHFSADKLSGVLVRIVPARSAA